MDEEEKKEKPKVKPPPWLLTFADLSTLIVTFFALMLSFANMDIIEFRQMMGSIEKAFGSSREDKGFYLATTTLEQAQVPSEEETSYEKQRLERATEKALKRAMGSEANQFEITGGADGFRVKIDSSFFFKSGSATLKRTKKVRSVLNKIAILIKKKRLTCIIEGYTDSDPIHTKKFPSNIHLSAARAESVASYLLSRGVPEYLIEAHGYGRRFLIYDENGREIKKKSRRVEFVFTDIRDTRFDIKAPKKEDM